MAAKKQKTKFKILDIFAIILTLLFLSPIVIIIINAAKDNANDIVYTPLALPENFLNLFSNFGEILTNPNVDYVNSLLNSIIITVLSVAVIIVASSMAAWVLVRSKRKISVVVFLLFISTMVIPFQIVMFPLVSWFSSIEQFLGMKGLFLGSRLGMIVANLGFGVPLSIFLFHGFIKSIPKELEEAAYIDGAGKFKTFFYIIFPILKPTIVTVAILNGIWLWNDFLLPLLILGKGNDVQTIPLAMANLAGAYVTDWKLILSGALLSMIPIVIVFLIGQKHIIKGMVEGSVKS